MVLNKVSIFQIKLKTLNKYSIIVLFQGFKFSLTSVKNLICIGLFLSISVRNIGQVYATEMEVRPGVKGIWFQPEEKENPDFSWQAQWIWLDEKMKSDVMLARQTFDLSETPKEALIRITASSKYQLFINGEYICQGPARSAPHHQSYDIFEISELLHEGKNLISVRVHHQKGKYSYHHDGRAGLLAQLDFSFNDQESVLMTNSKWKVSPDPSWDDEAPNINRFQQVVNDRVDMRNYLKSWTDIAFDESGWDNATPLMRNVGWPSPQTNATPQALTPPWTSLIPRDIPYLMETEVKAVDLIQVTEIEQSFAQQLNDGTKINPFKITGLSDKMIGKGLADYKKKNYPLVIPTSRSSKSWLLLFDFGEVLNGMPQLDIEGSSGTKIDLLCAPFMVDEKFTHQVVDSDFRDRIVLSGKRDQWEATYFKPTRFMGLVIHDVNKEVKVHYIGLRKLDYPFEEIGMIESNDAPWVKQYVEASIKTIKVCTTDGYTDNYRERRQYAQTGYYAALGNYWTFGDAALQRRYLIQIAQEQRANGIMPAYAPAASDDYMIIMDSNCLWIRSLRNYLLYSGDYKTTRELLPAASNLMGLLHSYTNSTGMIDNPPYAYWLDHALNDRRGANLNLNGHYLGALEDFAQVLEWLDDTSSEEFQRRADLLRSSLQEHLWDEEKQLFADALIDGNRSVLFSEHANAMALAMNIATPEQAAGIAKQLLIDDEHNYIKRTSGMTMVTPAMSYFLHKGLCEYGYIDESFELFRNRFDKMLDPGTNGTLWEEWWLDAIGRSGKLQKGRTRSDAQTESAFPPALFAEYLLGISPTRPGMKEIEVALKSSGIKNIAGSIPTPSGTLEIEWHLTNKNRELKLDVPAGMYVKVDLESLGIKSGEDFLLNGKTQNINLDTSSYITLSKGKQVIKF